jgi:hypothetical protein
MNHETLYIDTFVNLIYSLFKKQHYEILNLIVNIENNHILKQMLIKLYEISINKDNIEFFKYLMNIEEFHLIAYNKITINELEFLRKYYQRYLDSTIFVNLLIYTTYTQDIIIFMNNNNIILTDDQITFLLSHGFNKSYLHMLLINYEINIRLIKTVNKNNCRDPLLKNKIYSYVKNNYNEEFGHQILDYSLKCHYISQFLNNLLVLIKEINISNEIKHKINKLESIYSTLIYCK